MTSGVDMSTTPESRNMPIGIYIFLVSICASMWIHPVASAGVSNLAGFYLWAVGVFMVVTAIFALFYDDGQGGFRKPPRSLNWLTRLAGYGGIAWLAYHGYFALPGVYLFACAIFLLVGARYKKAGK
ncbi:MAG: hypothetical protein CME80_08400 [Halomonas sp.]|nr:hypothetical protein [Halomonas sp.]